MFIDTYSVTDANKLFTLLSNIVPTIFSGYNVTKTEYANTDLFKIEITTSNNETVMYFYVQNVLISGRNTINVTSYYSADTANNYIDTTPNNINGPAIVYNNLNVLYKVSGFMTTSANQQFLVDFIGVGINENNNYEKYIILGTLDTNMNFVISKTHQNNFGIVGVTAYTINSIYNVKIIAHNSGVPIEHNLYPLQQTESSSTSLTKLFIPKSTYSDYFDNVYLILSKQNNDSTYYYNGHKYNNYFNNYITLKVY
jgi:hypothetical protein